MPLVQISKLSKSYSLGDVTTPALQEVSLTIEAGSFVAIVGPSGSGKSTLLNLIGCLDLPTSGRIQVDGQDLAELNKKERALFRGRQLGFVFQNFNLIPVLTVYENVEYPLSMVQNQPGGSHRERIEELLKAVGIYEQRDKMPQQISGGQMQRVAVARALVTQPKLVVADEPTANLDHHTAYKIIDLMKQMKEAWGTTFVFSTHDAKIIGEAEVIHHLEDGRITGSEDRR